MGPSPDLGAVSPWADTAFAFSNDPATPYYAYVGKPAGVHRIDVRTLAEAPDTGTNPAWPVADQDVVWLHQSANDESGCGSMRSRKSDALG